MDGETKTKIVRYELYCKKCKHRNRSAVEDPCNECLTVPVNYGSIKPINFEEDNIL